MKCCRLPGRKIAIAGGRPGDEREGEGGNIAKQPVYKAAKSLRWPSRIIKTEKKR
jgi:hypothetical protein